MSWTTKEWIERQQQLARAGISMEEACRRLRANADLINKASVSMPLSLLPTMADVERADRRIGVVLRRWVRWATGIGGAIR